MMKTMPFFSNLDADLADALQQKLRVRWTHTSTALEGNTLTEGETLGVLQFGLTIAGRPLAHHNEVMGHGRALDMLYDLVEKRRDVTQADLFALHAAVQTAVEVDYLKPVGAWKVEANSTLAKLGNKAVINDTYADPAFVPGLMSEWLAVFNARRIADGDALEDYVWAHASFARIHPFANGNGRMARLLANLPVMAKGQLPILIPATERLRYIESLASWQLSSGAPRPGQDLLPNREALQSFQQLCVESEQASREILEEVQALQFARRA